MVRKGEKMKDFSNSGINPNGINFIPGCGGTINIVPQCGCTVNLGKACS